MTTEPAPNTPPSAPSALLRIALQIVGALWTSPYTLFGLIAGSVGLLFGAHAHWSRRDCAIVFHRWPWGPGGAMTIGNTILHTGDSLDEACVTYAHKAGHCHDPPIVLGDHERAHVYQYMVLGPLFVPLYFLCGGISVRNRFEQAADRYAMTGRGWWPWAR